jgi:hypothetical protein
MNPSQELLPSTLNVQLQSTPLQRRAEHVASTHSHSLASHCEFVEHDTLLARWQMLGF